jgi:hypothetical protein
MQILRERIASSFYWKLTRAHKRPRICQRVEPTRTSGLDATLEKLPPPVPTTKLIISVNQQIGDAGMAHLHLMPESITVFGVVTCGLTSR